jgi:hypothetical protein
MKLFFPQQAALQTVNQREDLGVSHFCSKRKTPAGVGTDRRDFVFVSRIAGNSGGCNMQRSLA